MALTLTAVISTVSGLALAPAQYAFAVAVAAVGAALRHLDGLRGQELHGLSVAEVVVHGYEPVTLVQVKGQHLLH